MDKKKDVVSDGAYESESLPQETLEIIETLPEEKRQIIISSFKASIFKGPVPHPDILKGYNDALENGADRILKMAEKQLEHRIQLEKEIISRQQHRSSLGQYLAFLLSIICISCATFLGYHNHTEIAGVIATTTILGLVSVFVIGKRSQDKL